MKTNLIIKFFKNLQTIFRILEFPFHSISVLSLVPNLGESIE